MFILHFIRGYVDGEGCLCYFWNKQHTSINTQVSIVSTESFLNSIKKLFGNKHGYIHNKSSKEDTFCTISDSSKSLEVKTIKILSCSGFLL